MKKVLLAITTLLFIFSSSEAQITFSDFVIKIEADVNDLPPTSSITATSECGEVTITVKETKFSGGCAGVLGRDYLAVDDCGNEAKTSQFIRLIDSTAPEVQDFPEEIAVDKNDIPEPIEPIFTDANYSRLDIEFTEKEMKHGLVRKWTATDACGNSSTVSQKLVFKTDL